MTNVNLVGPGIEAKELGEGVTLLTLDEKTRSKVEFMDSLSFEDKVKVWEALYPPKEEKDG